MKAIIYAAGLGTRFKPWTDHHPKALAVVNGKSLLQRNIEYLQQYGITEVVVNVHHFAKQVREAVIDNKGWGSKILISDETDRLLETGGGLMKAKHLLVGEESFISLNACFFRSSILCCLQISFVIFFFMFFDSRKVTNLKSLFLFRYLVYLHIVVFTSPLTNQTTSSL
jgi:hypothetical protein